MRGRPLVSACPTHLRPKVQPARKKPPKSTETSLPRRRSFWLEKERVTKPKECMRGRLYRNRKPRMKSLWQPGYREIGLFRIVLARSPAVVRELSPLSSRIILDRSFLVYFRILLMSPHHCWKSYSSLIGSEFFLARKINPEDLTAWEPGLGDDGSLSNGLLEMRNPKRLVLMSLKVSL